MALSEKQINEIKKYLDNCKNPLFFFDDDQDGLCSFLLFYRYKGEGNGIIVKTSPKLGTFFLSKVNEYHPDNIFVLDIADVERDFIDGINTPLIWIDHHGTAKKEHKLYFNPRLSNEKDNFPASFMCYQVVKQELKASDIWIAVLGCVADWFIPDFIEEFKKNYPDLLDKNYESPGDIIFNSQLGKLIRIFSFALKGKMSDVKKSIKIFTRIQSPYEILKKETEQGRFIYKRYEQVNKTYKELINEFMNKAKKTSEKLVFFEYGDDKMSLTSDLSNEAIYRFPEKIILIAREKNDEMKCSLRSSDVILLPIIEKCLIGLNGYGGGHEHACGLNVKTADFEEFVKRFREMV